MRSLAVPVLAEELVERGWSVETFVAAMPGDPDVNGLALWLWLCAEMPMDHDMAELIGAALGTSPLLWERLGAKPADPPGGVWPRHEGGMS